jgi:hypothetical protein
MKDTWALHHYCEDLETVNSIKEGEFSSINNKKNLLEYYDYMLSLGLSVPRIVKCLRLVEKIDMVLKRILRRLMKRMPFIILDGLSRASIANGLRLTIRKRSRNS